MDAVAEIQVHQDVITDVLLLSVMRVVAVEILLQTVVVCAEVTEPRVAPATLQIALGQPFQM
jgi:hypothetical protein